DCRARFVFGQSKQHPGTLFPQRKDREGKAKPNGGWSRWEGSDKAAEAAAAPASSTPFAKVLTAAIEATEAAKQQSITVERLLQEIESATNAAALNRCEAQLRRLDATDPQMDELAGALARQR